MAAGGTLLATGDFGACDEDGQARMFPACAVLPALAGAARPLAGAYFDADVATLRARVGGAPHLGAEGKLWMPELATADGWTASLRVIGPFRNNAPEFAVVRGPGSDPGRLSREHGDGKAIWLPWLVGAAFSLYGIDDHAAVLAEAVEPWVGAAPVVTSAPAAVSFSLARTPEGWLLHLFNDATVQGLPATSCLPLAGFDVAVACEATGATNLVTGAALPIAREMSRCKFVIDRLDTFCSIALST